MTHSTTMSEPAYSSSIGTRLDRMPITGAHRTLTLLIGLGLFFDYFDSNLSGTVSKVLQVEFGVDGNALKLFLASGFIGQFFGSILLGRLSDIIGRRRAFMLNLAVYSVFTLLGAFSPNVAWLIVTRFIAGVGIGAEQTLADCYLAEVLPARRRGRFIGWAYCIAFCGVPAVGFTALWLAPRTILGLAGWRWVFIIGALGTALIWILRRRLVESPRWLAEQGRTAEAEAIVSGLERQAGIQQPPAGTTPSMLGRPRPRPRPRPGYRELFGPLYWRRTVMLWTFCLLSVTAYYGFGTLAPQVLAVKGFDIVAGLGYTAMSFLGYPIGSLLSVPILDRVERRTLICVSATLMAASGIGFGLAGNAVAIVAFGFSYTLLSNVFSTASHVYLSEQYPTAFRTTAAGAAYSLSRLSAALLPFVLLPILTNAGAGWLFTVIAGCVVVMIVAVLRLGDRTTGTSVDLPVQVEQAGYRRN
ncbi:MULTISPECIES: MFS transporter [unclassified Solwaraspora]|uniref:MFS transporter n=1 Tax=unclassified Solwaraspora TaxID=2627926 RepID=UPI00248C7CBF|nr:MULTISPECIES: MFS transporter [unclassified Solwaraspora]WBB95633.1 MFS transporter [Solwaraspora sp. WMMA2059]WBC20463.1 MFS transporter [Solwaraspora sp. WMMA2080]WJK37384.1 MFS transporter [Solwaraspora sp. WMMA2065]